MADDDESNPPRAVGPEAKNSTPERERQQSVPPPDRLLAIIRFLAEHSERVIFTDHAQERMEERDITPEQVYRGLRTGELSGPIVAGRSPNEWKCKIVSRPRGSRKMGVVTIVINDEYLIVKTTEWEDR